MLLHSNVRWLSRGRVLNRFVALLEEIRYFLINRGKQCDELNDNDWLLDLAFMTDLSTHLNRLNLTLQGEQHLLPDLVQSVVAFRGMLHLLLQQIKSNDYTHFPTALMVKEQTNADMLYRCEAAFSRMSIIKSTHRARITDANLEHHHRCAQTKLQPDMHKLAMSAQAQESH